MIIIFKNLNNNLVTIVIIYTYTSIPIYHTIFQNVLDYNYVGIGTLDITYAVNIKFKFKDLN